MNLKNIKSITVVCAGNICRSPIGEVVLKHKLKEAGGPKLDRRNLSLKHPIKIAGKHRVPVKLHQSVSTAITINIVNK